MKQRLFKAAAWWMVGRALPRAHLLQAHLDALLRAIFLMIVAAICAGIALITGLFFSFRWLVERGMAEATGFVVVIALSVVGGIMAYRFSVREGTKAVHVNASLDLFGSPHLKQLGESAHVLWREFLAGLREESTAAKRGFRRTANGNGGTFYVHEAETRSRFHA